MKKSKYKIYDHLYRCECGREFDNPQSLNAHLSHCKYHHECVSTEIKKRPHEINGGMSGWDNFSDDKKREMHSTAMNTLKKRYKNGEIIPSWKNKHLPECVKEKQRMSMLKHIKEDCQQNITPRYSKRAIQFIEKLNIEKNWNLQHAENGGEKFINGYWVDGYDKNLNIVFEYDEPHHYEDVNQNILKEKDRLRQQYIIDVLGCEFYRYNEYLGLLYKV